MLPIICKLFDKENHDAFMEIANPDKISAFRIEDDEHKYSENSSFALVTGNLYVRQLMSSASILGTIMRISSAFDNVAGTDYAGNILFALK